MPDKDFADTTITSHTLVILDVIWVELLKISDKLTKADENFEATNPCSKIIGVPDNVSILPSTA